MFSEAYTYLNRSLRLAQTRSPNFQTIRDNLKAAAKAVAEDTSQSKSLRNAAFQSIQQAISYTYSRTNPMPPLSPMTFESMATPISPFQQNRMGPFGYIKGPIVPGRPDLVPTMWKQDQRETQVLALMIQKALNIVRRGLH